MAHAKPSDVSDHSSVTNNPTESGHNILFESETKKRIDTSNIVSKLTGLKVGLDFGKDKFTKESSRPGSTQHHMSPQKSPQKSSQKSKQRSRSRTDEDKAKPPLKEERTGDVHARLYNACLTGQLAVVRDILDEHFTTLMPDEEGQTPLYAACIGNQPDVVKYLVQLGYDVNHQDRNGKTPLHLAYQWKANDVVALLLKRFNASLSIRDCRQWTALHAAIDIGNYGGSQTLLQKFYDADIGTDVAWIQLHAACYDGDLEKIACLVAAGADINRASSIAYTPLHVACTENKTDVVKFLLEHGADKDIERAVSDGLLPLHMAATKPGATMVRYLLEHGADPNAAPQQVTATHYAVDRNNREAVECLIAWPTTNLQAVDKSGDTLLHRAVSKRNADIVTLLLEKDVDVNCLNYFCVTPLHITVSKQESRIVEKLLAAGAKPDIKDVEGWTSLMRALCAKHYELVDMLLLAGASVNACDSDGNTSLHLAVAQQCGVDIIQKLLRHNASPSSVNLKLQTPLLLACSHYQRDVIKLLLTSGADPALADDRGQTCLHWAAVHQECDASTLHALLARGAHINVTDVKGKTAVRCACSAKTWTNMLTLLREGADPNIGDSIGDTILHKAVGLKSTPDILQAIIAHGVNVNAQNKYLSTALHYACTARKSDAVEVLLQARADPSKRNHQGNTCLHLAVHNGCGTEVLQQLVQHGADVNALNDDSETALLLLSITEQRDVKHVKAVVELLRLGADPNVCDANGETCLHWAVHRRAGTEVMQAMIKHGVDVNILDHLHRTALVLAGLGEDLAAIEVLLNAGANPNLADSDGNTMLHIAVIKQLGPQTLQRIIDAGAQLDVVNDKERTALILACYNEQVELVRVLLRNGANADLGPASDYKCLHIAVDRNNTELLKSLVSYPLDLNVVNQHEDTALYLACAIGQRGIAKILMEKGADLNIGNTRLNTALHKAVAKGDADIVHDLLQHGADVNLIGQHCFTPLHVAVSYGSEVCMKILLRYTPNLNIQDNEGNTPLIGACKMGQRALIRLLLEHGADAGLQDYNGRSAVHFAVKECDLDLLKLFLDHSPSVVDAVVGDNEPLLHLFSRKGKKDLVGELLSRGVDTDKLCGQASAIEVAHKNGHMEIVMMLIDAGADVSRRNNRFGFLDMIYAQRHKIMYMDILERIILSPKCSVDLAAVNEAHETLLLQACRDGAVEVVAKLLQSHKSIGMNVPDRLGYTPVMKLCVNCKVSQPKALTILPMLLSDRRTLDLRCVNFCGRTALHWAVRNDSILVANILVSACPELVNIGDVQGFTPLHMAPSAQMVDFLVKRGADVNRGDHFGRTALLYSAAMGHQEAVSALLAVLPPDAVNVQDNFGRSLLHHCASINALHFVKDVRGLELHLATIDKQTALHLAVLHNDVDGTRQLLQVGANPCAVDKNGMCPLHLAAEPKCRELLIQHKAPETMRSHQGDTPDMMAQWHAQIQESNTKKLGPEILSKSHDALLNIMKMPFVGLGQANEEHHREQGIIWSQLQQLMEKVRQQVQETDPMFAFEVKPSGSFEEGTVVGLPDMATFMCLLNKVPEMLQLPNKDPYSNINVRLSARPDFPADTPGLVDHNGDVIAQALFSRFCCAVTRALAVAGIWQDFPQLYFVKLAEDNTELKVQLMWHGKVYKWLPISLRILFGLVFPDWQPSWIAEKHGVSQSQIPVLFKKVPHSDSNKRLVFQLSFAAAEAAVLKKISPQLKEGLQLAKLMRHDCICSPPKPNPQELASSAITEEMLRTVCLRVYEESLRSDKVLEAGGVNPVIKAAQVIYERLNEALQGNVLGLYFLSNHNILIDLVQGKGGYERRELTRLYCTQILSLLQKTPNPSRR